MKQLVNLESELLLDDTLACFAYTVAKWQLDLSPAGTSVFV